MCKFTVTIELKGRHVCCDDYNHLDSMMGLEGFERKTPLPTRLHPANLFTHPDNPAHATYDGQCDSDGSEIYKMLVGKIEHVCHSEISMFVAETVR